MAPKGFLHIAVTVLALMVSAPLAASARNWESVRTDRVEARTVVREQEFEIRTAPLTIYITAGHPVQIKIFTILGRLVNSDTLAPGTQRLVLPAHGVYIVKIGDTTCKVAV